MTHCKWVGKIRLLCCDGFATCRYSGPIFVYQPTSSLSSNLRVSLVFVLEIVVRLAEAKKSKTRQPDRNWIVLYCFDQPFSSIFSVRFFPLLFPSPVDVVFFCFSSCHNHKQKRKKPIQFADRIKKNLKYYHFFSPSCRFSVAAPRSPKQTSKNGNMKKRELHKIFLQCCMLPLFLLFFNPHHCVFSSFISWYNVLRFCVRSTL